MTLTQALHFYNSKKRPTQRWMDLHYSHFTPTERDEKIREQNLKPKTVRKKVQRELFD